MISAEGFCLIRQQILRAKDLENIKHKELIFPGYILGVSGLKQKCLNNCYNKTDLLSFTCLHLALALKLLLVGLYCPPVALLVTCKEHM